MVGLTSPSHERIPRCGAGVPGRAPSSVLAWKFPLPPRLPWIPPRLRGGESTGGHGFGIPCATAGWLRHRGRLSWQTLMIRCQPTPRHESRPGARSGLPGARVLSEADVRQRAMDARFGIDAVVALSLSSEVGQQRALARTWERDGTGAEPPINADGGCRSRW